MYSLNVEPDLATMLAAFLYSAHIHNAPILIAGPCGQDIANALSVSLYADNAGQLMFGEQFDCDIADAVNNVNEHIVAAQNTNHLLAADVDMTREEYNKLRGGSVREVTSTRGTISLRDVISDSQE